MLLQITNNCNEHCSHCLHNSLPSPTMMMSKETFDKALQFAHDINTRIVIVSGGEPTLHPLLEYFCTRLSEEHLSFIIATNGSWVTDNEKTKTMQRISGMIMCEGIQVTTDKRYYPNYWSIKRASFGHVKKVEKTFDCVNDLQDLGRAKQLKFECETSPSCINAKASIMQVPIQVMGMNLEKAGRFCTPLVDWKGNIHLSESCLCPSQGTVYDNLQDIESKMREWKCCGGCRNMAYFLNQSKHNSRYDKVKQIINL